MTIDLLTLKLSWRFFPVSNLKWVPRSTHHRLGCLMIIKWTLSYYPVPRSQRTMALAFWMVLRDNLNHAFFKSIIVSFIWTGIRAQVTQTGLRAVSKQTTRGRCSSHLQPFVTGCELRFCHTPNLKRLKTVSTTNVWIDVGSTQHVAPPSHKV